MTAGTVVWLIVAAIAAGLYFGIAAVVSVYGIKDLRKLLGGADRPRK